MSDTKRKTNNAERDDQGSVRIPRALRQRLKLYAVKSEKPLHQVAAEIIEDGLKRRGA